MTIFHLHDEQTVNGFWKRLLFSVSCLHVHVSMSQCVHVSIFHVSIVRYHTGGSMKLNARILHLAHMVYL
jgi:hypothetical protein